MIMETYYTYQPVTWYIGVIEANAEDIASVTQPLHAPEERLVNIKKRVGSMDAAIHLLQPLKLADKLLLIETIDGRTVLFGNAYYALPQQPTWYAARKLSVCAYYICNEPTTISRDRRSGKHGARILEFRKPEHPFGYDPTFRIAVINDAGRWCFEKYGKDQPFEDRQAYKARRKANRFTVEMLNRYCHEFGIPIYDRNWYSDRMIMIQMDPFPDVEGVTFEQARKELRVKEIDC